VHIPFGAHPSSCAPAYGFDVKHFKEYVQSAKEEGGWSSYAQRYVNCTQTEYLERVGGTLAIGKLPLPVF
jgi:glutaconate CoA-transferase subunit A